MKEAIRNTSCAIILHLANTSLLRKTCIKHTHTYTQLNTYRAGSADTGQRHAAVKITVACAAVLPCNTHTHTHTHTHRDSYTHTHNTHTHTQHTHYFKSMNFNTNTRDNMNDFYDTLRLTEYDWCITAVTFTCYI